MKNWYRFEYQVLGTEYSVNIHAISLNKAMIEFATKYHQIEIVFSIKQLDV